MVGYLWWPQLLPPTVLLCWQPGRMWIVAHPGLQPQCVIGPPVPGGAGTPANAA